MMTVLTRASNNQLVTLSKQIASSGEGEVWETNISGILAKIYHNLTADRIEKLKVMLANPPIDPMASQNHVSIAFPLDLLKNGSGAYIGFLMPAIRDSRELTTVYNPSLRKKKAPGFNWYYLHATALNTAWIIQSIHDKGYVLGDIKPQNILVNDRALVAVIDTDSFQVCGPHTEKVYRCTVGSEGFTPVELLGKDFSTTDQTEIHDRFRLAVLIHYLLFGYHPFSGQWVGSGDSPDQTELIRTGFWYGGQNSLIRPSQNTIPLDVVHPEIKRYFLKCFNDGHTTPDLRPTAEEWHNALQVAINELTVCDKVDSHHYSQNYGKCYWCERAVKLRVDIFPGSSGTSSTTLKTTTTPSTATQTVEYSTLSSQTSQQSTLQFLGNSLPTKPLNHNQSSTVNFKTSSPIQNNKLRNILQVGGAVLLLGLGIYGYRQTQEQLQSSTNNITYNCPENPQVILPVHNVEEIQLDSQWLIKPGQVSNYESVGYKFTAQAGQKFNYRTNADICIWIYGPDNQLLNSGEELPQTGRYIIQVSPARGSTNFNLEMSLDPNYGTLSK